MAEISPAVAALTLTPGNNPLCENSNMEIALMTKTASLRCSPSSVLTHDNSRARWDDDDDDSCDLTSTEENECTSSPISGFNSDNNEITQRDVDEEEGNILSDYSVPINVEIEGDERGQIVVKVIAIEERNIKGKISVEARKKHAKDSESDLQFSCKKDMKKDGPKKSVFELDFVPLWGSSSIQGHRPEMEDALVAVPHFMKIPIEMFIGDGIRPTITHLNSHFFGVYDGHGGSQVANYCKDRIHIALAEELTNHLTSESFLHTRQARWEKVFTNCFLKVDDEISGKKSNEGNIKFDEKTCNNLTATPAVVAPETVGSTAVVAVISSSHIIVSNCGDSRAVLYRGKEAIPLSVDHKPNREDECARIESSGGKVIKWNGHRVCGVLAMSRAIGDRFLKPWIIAVPDVTFLPRAREDECLILASDGLWDVMTNEEACEAARKRILTWHKKNTSTSEIMQQQSADPAALAAAEHLCSLAIRKGSKDNISVIVVDLKSRRKKTKNEKP